MPKKLVKGCNAIAEAAILGGCRFFAGYPITPQSEIPEYLAEHLPEVGGTFIQGESEVASINMVYGAAACGVPIVPGGKYMFGTVTVGEKGQIVIPAKARKIFHIHPGDSLVVLGDITQGLALIDAQVFLDRFHEATRQSEEGR